MLPEKWLLQTQAQQLLLLPWLGTPVLPVPLADTGHIPLPTSSQIPQTDTPVLRIQLKIAAWAWSFTWALAKRTVCPWPDPCQRHPPTARSHTRTASWALLLVLPPSPCPREHLQPWPRGRLPGVRPLDIHPTPLELRLSVGA